MPWPARQALKGASVSSFQLQSEKVILTGWAQALDKGKAIKEVTLGSLQCVS